MMFFIYHLTIELIDVVAHDAGIYHMYKSKRLYTCLMISCIPGKNCFLFSGFIEPQTCVYLQVGMSIDPKLFISEFPIIIGGLSMLLIGKTVVVACIGRLFGLSPVAAVRAGLLLAPGGEFAFVAFGEAVNQVRLTYNLLATLVIFLQVTVMENFELHYIILEMMWVRTKVLWHESSTAFCTQHHTPDKINADAQKIAAVSTELCNACLHGSICFSWF
jgi:hypothetical protein